jgi:general secretion pathway protein N
MRLRLRTGRTILFLGLLLFALVALIPMRLAVAWFGGSGLSAREVSGSIWFGTLKEAQFGPVALGDVRARLNLLPLFWGQARLSLSREGPDGSFEGAVSVWRHGFAVEDLTGQVRAGGLFAPAPIGTLDFEDVSVSFASGSCESASGRVRASATGAMAGIALPGALAGDARCAEGALLLPLASESGLGQANLSLRGDGGYRIEIVIRQIDPSMASALAAAGFQPNASGYVRRVEGHF